MIERRTKLDQIEITGSGSIQLRIGLLIVEGVQELDCKWHRSICHPGCDIDAQIAAVDVDVTTRGYPPVPKSDISRIKKYARITWVPAVVDKFRRQGSLEERMKARSRTGSPAF
jgi:hypothetical protein